jgi:predicted nucleic acid-binding protein
VAVIVDASLLVPLAVDDSRAPVVRARLERWLTNGEVLHAPELLPYEVASGITRLVAAALFPAERVSDAWRALIAVPVTYHPLLLGEGVVAIARQLQRHSAYDAAYLALAEELGAALWTLDSSLARNASDLGFPVHLIA